MLLFWIIVFLLVATLSFILTWRSMANFRNKLRVSSTKQELFLIRTPDQLNLASLDKLTQFSQRHNLTFSLEKLFKGEEVALVIYGPSELADYFPEWNLLSLEDYLIPESVVLNDPKKVRVDESFGWEVPLKSRIISADFLDRLDLKNDERFFWQLVIRPETNQSDNEQPKYQLTIRALVAGKNATEKVKLAKRLFNQMAKDLNLEKGSVLENLPSLYDSFLYRTLGQKNQTVKGSEVLKLLGL